MPKRKKKATRTALVPLFLIAIGLILLSLWGLHRFLYNRSLRLSDRLLASYSRESIQSAVPIYITVADSISLRVVEAGKVEGAWTVSPTAANHVRGSALPGQAGNTIIFGHNLNTVFGYLVDARVGDPVDIRTYDGKLHRYKISEIQIVDPSQTALLSPTTREVLTLYTCTGLLDSLRFVARAEPVK
jgi:sortase A